MDAMDTMDICGDTMDIAGVPSSLPSAGLQKSTFF